MYVYATRKMGKGRSACCDKSKVKRGPWSPSEDLKLVTFIQNHGHANWRALPAQAGLLRCGKSCRLRWINYLRPDLKRGDITPEEEETITKLHETYGNKWSKIASFLPGRTDNEIKNAWNTHIKKKLGLKCVQSCAVKRRKSFHDSAESATRSFVSRDDEVDQEKTADMISLSDIEVRERATLRELEGFQASLREDEDEQGESPTPSSIASLSNVLTSKKEHGHGQMDMTLGMSAESTGVVASTALDESVFQTTHDLDELDFWNTLELDNLCPIQCIDIESKAYKACEGSTSSGFNQPNTSNVEAYS